MLLAASTAAPVMGEPLGPDCGYAAWVDDSALRRYDGLRLGLERARLPRVCRIEPGPQGDAGLIDEQRASVAQGSRAAPLFLVGEGAVGRALPLATDIPAVYAVVRYLAGGELLEPLPEVAAWSGVVAEVDAARVGRLLSAMGPDRRPRVLFGPGTPEDVAARFARAAELDLADESSAVDVVLHLRLLRGAQPPEFEAARALALQRRAILVSDDRARFGQGAGVLLLPDDDMLGRQAAEQARRWRALPQAVPPTRGFASLEVWVDLEALDRQGLALPLPFLARADRLRRGLAPGSPAR